MFNTKTSHTQAVSHLSTLRSLLSLNKDVRTNQACYNYIIQYWSRDNWTPRLSRLHSLRLYRALKHPERSIMSKVIRESLGYTPIPLEIKAEIESIRCLECADTPERPQKPKISLTPESNPDVVGSLDVMQHKICN